MKNLFTFTSTIAIIAVVTFASCTQPSSPTVSDPPTNPVTPTPTPAEPTEIPEGVRGNLAGKTIQLQTSGNTTNSQVLKSIVANTNSNTTAQGTFSADGNTLTVNGVNYPFVESASTETRAVYGSGNTYYAILSSGSSLFQATPSNGATFTEAPNEATLKTATKHEAPVTGFSTTTAPAYLYFLHVVSGQEFTLSNGSGISGTFSQDGMKIVPNIPGSTTAPITFQASKSVYDATSKEYRAVFVDSSSKYFGALIKEVNPTIDNGLVTAVSGKFYYILTPNTQDLTIGYDTPEAIVWNDTTKQIAATLEKNSIKVDAETFLNEEKGKTFTLTSNGIQITATLSASGKTIKSTTSSATLYDIVFVESESKKISATEYRSVWTDGYGYYGIKKLGSNYSFYSDIHNNTIPLGYSKASDIPWANAGTSATVGGVPTNPANFVISDATVETIKNSLVTTAASANTGVVGIVAGGNIANGITLIPATNAHNEIVAAQANSTLTSLITVFKSSLTQYNISNATLSAVDATSGTSDQVTLTLHAATDYKFADNTTTKAFTITIRAQSESTFGDGQTTLTTIPTANLDFTIPEKQDVTSSPGWEKINVVDAVAQNAGGRPISSTISISAYAQNGKNNEVVVADFVSTFNTTLATILSNMPENSGIQSVVFSFNTEPSEGDTNVAAGKITLTAATGFIFEDGATTKNIEVHFKPGVIGFGDPKWGDGQP